LIPGVCRLFAGSNAGNGQGANGKVAPKSCNHHCCREGHRADHLFDHQQVQYSLKAARVPQPERKSHRSDR
jgi:hypothetical protein